MTTTNYLLKDNLGSVVSTVDLSALNASPSSDKGEPTAFNSWGLRRNSDWSDMSLSSIYDFKSNVTDRGFTRHEQIDELGLIHMNGRVYDPVIGRFISADPIIQDPTDLQSLNRYTYVRNNPLSFTDPTGFSWWSKKGKRLIGKAFAIVFPQFAIQTKQGLREFGRFARKNKYVAEVAQIAGCAAFSVASAGVGATGCAYMSSMVTYGVTDGDLQAAAKAGATAFVQAGLSYGIGNAKFGIFGSTISHGALGGAISKANGGSFRSGALAGSLGHFLGGAATGVGEGFSGMMMRTTIAAIVGGTVSKLSGGTFANGARTAAMQHLFNQELHRPMSRSERLAYLEQTMGVAPNDILMALHAGLNLNRATLIELMPGLSRHEQMGNLTDVYIKNELTSKGGFLQMMSIDGMASSGWETVDVFISTISFSGGNPLAKAQDGLNIVSSVVDATTFSTEKVGQIWGFYADQHNKRFK